MPEHGGAKIHAVNRQFSRQGFKARRRLLKVTQPDQRYRQTMAGRQSAADLEPGQPVFIGFGGIGVTQGKTSSIFCLVINFLLLAKCTRCRPEDKSGPK